MSACPSPETSGGFASSDALALPRVFGRLVLLKLIARGGMGDVYLAATTGIEGAERPCVVKTVRRDHVHDGSFLARFLDEARVQAQLNHPGVAQVLEASTDENGEPYTVVELVEGRSLADVRSRAIQLGQRVGWAEATAVAIEMANALAHVHERAGSDGTPLGIVHRDLSPQNVMVGYLGEVKLIDFGTARGQNRKCHTVAGVVFAKPGYVAPEVARQQVGDARIDLYALGIMLWELCAGRRFLTGDAQKHLEEAAAGKVAVPLLAELVDAPRELDDVIQKMVANDPDERYPGAGVAANELSKVLAKAPPGKNGERSVRGRIQSLMRVLWPHEPARSRGEFAKLLKGARGLSSEQATPTSSRAELAAQHMMVDDPAVLPGTPYRLVQRIGEGASGVVWEGEHVELGRRLAIKVLLPGHASASDAIDRFRREARTVARLSHPNLVQLYDFGRALDGRVFLAMELLRGRTVDEHLTEKRGMDWREAVNLGMDTCRALEAAHAAGLVHRDLKPANLFLTEQGTVKLLDFGVAMAMADVAGDEKRQQGFAIFGTPEYMAPEQVAGESVDARCDLYALGCLLYELLTGSCPFEGPSNVVVMGKQLRETPESPTTRAPLKMIPADIEAVVMKLLEKKPEDRYATAAEVRLALGETLLTPARHRARVRRTASVFAGLTMLVCFGVAGAAYRVMHPVASAGETNETSASIQVTPAAEVASPAPPPTGTAVLGSEAAPALTPPQAELSAQNDAPLPKPTATTTPVLAALLASAGTKVDIPAPVRREVNAIASENAKAMAAAKANAREKANAKAEASDVTVREVVAREEDTSAAANVREPAVPRADLAELADTRAFAKEHPSDRHALKTWAIAASRAGAMREARRAGEAWALKEDTLEPHLFLAMVLEMTGRAADAKSIMDQWLEVHPDSTEARKFAARLAQSGAQAERVVHRAAR
jgi:serine/threonine-protein kinase